MDKIKLMIENNNYQLAIEELKKMESSEEVCYLLTKCYINTKELEKALIECKKGLDKATNYYYHLVELQLEILIELNYQEEALVLVVNELSMPYIPKEFETKYQALYQRVVANKNRKNNLVSVEKIKEVLISDEKDLLVISQVIEALENYNLRLLIKEIEYFLLTSNQSLMKTVILELLCEQKINQVIKMKVEGMEVEVNPFYLESINDSPVYSELLLKLKKQVYSEDVSLFNTAHHLCFLHLGSQYPILPDIDEVDMLVEAYIWQARKMLGQDLLRPSNQFVEQLIKQLTELV